ncbi:MAG TPA: isoprenylcysteine carboxylmethyltransferase family protein, partial [Caldimonas sp.]|nr:isoprenylcysteine carboxylmethyltransferase family protein [Caldimonas sp.]
MRADAAGWTIAALWLCWGAYWAAASIAVNAAVRRESIASRMLHIAPLFLAGALLWSPRQPFDALRARFVPLSAPIEWASVAIVGAGFAFTVWARVHLGANWSGIVTVKRDHTLVTTGPYAIVRHPIYTGLLLAFAGTALALGEVRGVLAVALAAASLWRKLR